MSDKKLKRSNDKKIMGVCGGIADYLGIDSTIVRIAYALLTLFTAGFPGILIYFILGFIMPEN